MSAWPDLVTAGLIGTGRAAVPVAAIPGLPAVEDVAHDPALALFDSARALLDHTALLTAARRAGRRPGHAEPLPVCEPDPRPAVRPAARDRLARILGGAYPDLLAEWLTAATFRGLRPPSELLPALLDRARRAWPADSVLPGLVAEAGGPRAAWLAALNPDWDFMPHEDLAAAEAWRLGDAGQRRGYLASLLPRDPEAARELVMGSWGAAGPGERAMFLSVWAGRPASLAPADEPLLEAALDDRAEDVRGWAAYLLARLPGSALGQRMAERARRCLRLEHGVGGARLVITLPAERDATMWRDGIRPGPVAGSHSPVHPPSLADRMRLVSDVLARTPLRTWTDEFGLTAAQIAALPSGDWAPLLFSGWARAAIAQRHRDWMAVLLDRALTGRPGTAAEIEALRQLARRADPALGAPDALPGPGPDALPAIRDAIRVLRFRHDMLKELDDDHSAG